MLKTEQYFRGATFFLLMLLFSVQTVYAQGSHVGGGGDIRRFRAENARLSLIDLLHKFSKNILIPKCKIHITEDLDPLIIKNAEYLYQWALRSHNQWQDPQQSRGSQNQCLNAELRTADILFNFLYQHCPLPTPKNPGPYHINTYYFALITDQFFKLFFPKMTADSISRTLREVWKFNNSCNYEIGPGKAPSREFDPSDFKDPKNAKIILEEGRELAIRIYGYYRFDALDRPVSTMQEPVLSFLKRSQKTLLDEVMNSPFSVDSSTHSCGFTELRPKATIYFSTQKCTDFQNSLDVAWVILHEATHHLSIQAENFADAVATELMYRFYLY